LANAPRKVLLVDDNADAVAVVAAWLKRAGHEVHEARDGLGATELARRLRPDFVFLDLGLPGMDGLAVARSRLRSVPAQADRSRVPAQPARLMRVARAGVSWAQ